MLKWFEFLLINGVIDMRIWYLYFFIVLYIWCVFGNKLELMLKLLNLEENLLLNLKKSFLIDRVFFMLFLNFFINLSRIFCVMLFWNREIYIFEIKDIVKNICIILKKKL